MKRTVRTTFYLVCAFMLTTTTCHAYLDPATTSYIIQIAAGVLIALGTVVGIFWNKITRVFRKKKTDTAEPAPVRASEIDESNMEITAADLLDDTENE